MSQTLEQFALMNCIVAGAVEADSLYCADDGERERCNDQNYMNALADQINAKVSQNQLENTVSVLEHVLSRRFSS